MRSLDSAVKVRRLALATTSGSGRGGGGGRLGRDFFPRRCTPVGLAPLGLPTFRGGQNRGRTEEIPLFFTLIPVLALLSNYDQENCLINVGTEGGAPTDQGCVRIHRTDTSALNVADAWRKQFRLND